MILYRAWILLSLLRASVSSLKATIMRRRVLLTVDPVKREFNVEGGPTDIGDKEAQLLTGLRDWLGRGRAATALDGEMIDWISDGDDGSAVICSVPRTLAVTLSLRHRGIGVMLLTPDGREVLVHKRAETKRVFPSMLDQWVGGVCGVGERELDTLRREVSEETGIAIGLEGGPETTVYLGQTDVQTAFNNCLVHAYAVRLDAAQVSSMAFRDGEISWGRFMPLEELRALLASKRADEFVPDGMQVWNWAEAEGKLAAVFADTEDQR